MSESPSPKPPPSKPAAESGPQRTPTNPEAFKVLSAQRMAGIKQKEEPKTFKEKAKAVGADVALNTAALLKQLAKDFKESDRFFKYKAGIIALWLALSVTGFVVACPGSSTTAHNSLDAKLTVTQVAGDPVYSLKNTSDEPWTEILVVVNGDYRYAAPNVAPNDMLTFEVKRLTGPNGKPAPKDMAVTSLELRTEQGKSVLIKDGQPVE